MHVWFSDCFWVVTVEGISFVKQSLISFRWFSAVCFHWCWCAFAWGWCSPAWGPFGPFLYPCFCISHIDSTLFGVSFSFFLWFIFFYTLFEYYFDSSTSTIIQTELAILTWGYYVALNDPLFYIKLCGLIRCICFCAFWVRGKTNANMIPRLK